MMPFLLPALIGVASGALLGICIGWIARGRDWQVVEKVIEKVLVKPPEDLARQRDNANEILTQLQQLTSGVSARIDEHSRTVGDINNELTGADSDASKVVVAIQRLVDSNNVM